MSLLLRGIVQPRCGRALRQRAGEIVDRTAAGRTHPRDGDILGKRCIDLMPDAHAALDLALRSADPVMRRRRAATARARRPRDVFAGARARHARPVMREYACAHAVPVAPRARRRSARWLHVDKCTGRMPALPDDHRSAGSPRTTCRVRHPRSRPEPHRPEEPAARRRPGAVAAHWASNIQRRGQLSARSYRLDRPHHPVVRGPLSLRLLRGAAKFEDATT